MLSLGVTIQLPFFVKVKTRPVDTAENSDQFLNAFGQLDTSADMNDFVEDGIDAYVCSMYGKPNLTKIDDASVAVFQDKFAPKDDKHSLGKIKGVDVNKKESNDLFIDTIT